MKSLGWKNIRIVVLLLCGVGFFVLLKLGNQEFLNTGTPKTVEIKNIQIGGWKTSHKQWAIKTKSAWAYQNLDQSTVEDVFDGEFYDQGKVILKNLKAKLVHANSQSGRLQADHQISAVILRYQKSGVQPVQIFAEQLLYDSNTLQTQLLKDVRLHEGENKIYTQEALLDHGSQQVFFKQGILFKHAQDTLRAPQLTITEQRNEYHFSGGVTFSRENLQSYCQEVISIMKNNFNHAQLRGKIKVRQRGKILLGENGFYDEAHDTLTISKNAELLMNQSGTLPEESDLSRLQRQDIKNLLENEVLVKAEQLIVHIGSGDVEALGNVSIKRKNQQARALRAHFNQKEHQILLSESAEIQQADGNWVSAEQVLVNTQTQEFTALGKVETTIFHNEQ